jgi:hypothetical protein
MGLSTDIVRFARLAGAEQRMIGEALAELAACSLAIARLPFARAVAFGSVPVARREVDPGTAEALATRLCRTIEALARRVPWKAKCFQQGLALQRMLRRRGVDARLHYGIATTDKALEAHVWIVVAGRVVMGGAEAVRFREVAVFPRAAR